MKMREGMLKALLIAVLAAEIGLINIPVSIAATTEETLYKFKGGAKDGANPGGVVMLADGSLLGTTGSGGGGCTAGCGVLFQLVPPSQGASSWTEKVLYHFSQSENINPTGLTLSKSGSLYGVTVEGAGLGSVFKVERPKSVNSGWTVTTIFRFGDNAGGLGSYPRGAVVEDTSGNLYGTAGGGYTCGYYPPGQNPFPIPIQCGIVYKLSPPSGNNSTWTETDLYSFKGNSNDGDLPGDLIIGRSGELYGVTQAGGRGCPYIANSNLFRGCGTVFRLSPPSAGRSKWTETILHFFAGGPSDGANPIAALILDSNGNLFGSASDGYTTQNTPQGGGGVFELSPPASGKQTWLETTLWKFEQIVNGQIDSRGGYPYEQLTLGEGRILYGTTLLAGGNTSSGVVFALNPPAKGKTSWTETVLHAFTNTDGAGPQGPGMIFDKKTGNLFGAAPGGGIGTAGGFGGNGVVFEISP